MRSRGTCTLPLLQDSRVGLVGLRFTTAVRDPLLVRCMIYLGLGLKVLGCQGLGF